MANYNLVTIRPKGFLHSSAFAEVKDSLAWALTSLGHSVLSTENSFSAGNSTNVIFGAEILSPTSVTPDNSILFNMEQPSHPNMDNLRRLAAHRTVWDFSLRNVAEWKKLGVDARHLPIGYTPNLTRIPRAATQDIDVAFVGWMTPRRRALVQELKASGMNIFASDCCYGGARDQVLSRSKVVLNVHHDGRDMFEIVRVSYLLSNSKCVVTENSSDGEDYWSALDGALEWSDYADLAERCYELAHDEPTRRNLETCAAVAMRRLDFTDSVRRVLGVDAPTAIQSRYERGCREGDMKDFLPLLRGIAKGRILEIGTRDGASTSAFLLGLEERGGHLDSFDISDCSGLWTHPQWTFHRLDSKKANPADGSYDLALIDGDHSPEGFLSDLRNCLRWVRPGGLILVHDITPLPNYTKEAAEGEWPSQFVGKYFFKECQERKLQHFAYPGVWGMGVIIVPEAK